ncbi:hypothetical protein ACJJTC_002620, partial [Scirpophaga incertulas]
MLVGLAAVFLTPPVDTVACGRPRGFSTVCVLLIPFACGRYDKTFLELESNKLIRLNDGNKWLREREADARPVPLPCLSQGFGTRSDASPNPGAASHGPGAGNHPGQGQEGVENESVKEDQTKNRISAAYVVHRRHPQQPAAPGLPQRARRERDGLPRRVGGAPRRVLLQGGSVQRPARQGQRK